MSSPSVEPVAVFTGIPSFFRHCCTEVREGRPFGSPLGYDHPGYHLARHICDLAPHDYDDEDWSWLDYVENGVRPLIDADDRSGLLAWLLKHYPKCIALIPSRRRERFVDGFIQGFDA